jgi:hypothetical protein
MADTATTVNEITTHFFGDTMARDLGFNSNSNTNCYGALDSIPRAMDTRGALLDLDDALGQVADASTPRAPVDLPFLKVKDQVKPPKAYCGADWRYPNKGEAEQEEERVWVDDNNYDSDATLAIEGDYAFATEAEQKARHHLLRAPGDAPIESDEEVMMMEEAAPAAAVSVRGRRACRGRSRSGSRDGQSPQGGQSPVRGKQLAKAMTVVGPSDPVPSLPAR